MQEILQVKNVSKAYGKGTAAFQALQNITFTINEGEFVAVMGPSGAGKSTLLNVLATIDQATAGEIIIAQTNVANMKEDALADFRRDHLGFIFQDYNLLDSLTVRENIVLPLAIAKVSTNEINQKVEEMAATFGISNLLEKYPYQISGGQKQRTASSRALVTEPKLIFADEPTGALDSKSATDLLQKFEQLNAQKQTTIMMVTHDAYAASFCQRIIFINDGKLSKELHKGSSTRKAFFQQILDELATMGGGVDDVI